MATADGFVQDIINQALTVGANKADEAKAYADQAAAAASGFSYTNPLQATFTPDNVEPPVNIPTSATGVDSALYNTTYDQIKNDLTSQFANFFVTYFPNECNYLAAAQERLCSMLAGELGMPTEIEDQIWQRDRSRVLTEVARANQEVIATFAARRYPIPPGAAVHQMQMQQIEAQNKVAQHSRDVAIKQVEIVIENIKFAVQQALEYRIKGIAAAAEYIKTLALGPEIAMKLATSAADAQAKLISAANTYYGSRIRLEELKFEVKKFNAGVMNHAQEVDVREFSERLKARVQVLSASAQAAGTQAAAALNAVHASAQVTLTEDTA